MKNQRSQGENLLSPRKAAELAGVSTRTLARWEEDGLLHSVRNGPGRHRRYLKDELLVFLNGSHFAKDRAQREKSEAEQEMDAIFSEIDSPDDWIEVNHGNRHSGTAGSPDERFTSWDRDTAKARAEVEIESLKQQREALMQERERARYAMEHREAQQQRDRVRRHKIEQIRNIAMLPTQRLHYVSRRNGMVSLPSGFVSRISRELESMIANLVSASGDGDVSGWVWMDAQMKATKLVNDKIEGWVAAHRENSNSANKRSGRDFSQGPLSSRPPEDDDEYDDFDEDDYDEDDEDDWEYEDE
jgi:DNA-binding transcriptional MerR regulator